MLTIFAAAAALLQPALEVVTPPPIAQVPVNMAPSEEAIAEAAKLFEGDAFRDQLMAGVMMGLNEGIQQELARNGATDEIDDATLARLHDGLMAEFATIIDTELAVFRREAALIYARRFSLDELRELHALMQRPVFKKMEQLTPLLMLEMERVSTRLFQPHMPALMERAAEIAAEIAAERTGGSRS